MDLEPYRGELVAFCYRMLGSLTFPTILGTGERLFPAGGPPADLELVSAGQAGAAVLVRYRRATR